MLDYVYGQDELVAQWTAQRIAHVGARGFGKCKAIGVVNGRNELIAGLVYHNWGPEAGIIDLSVAAVPSSRWMTRETIRRMYEYPFYDCGVQMVSHCVLAEDEGVQRILAGLGCMLIRIPRLYGRERDGVLALLTREEWQNSRFIRRPELRLEEAA